MAQGGVCLLPQVAIVQEWAGVAWLLEQRGPAPGFQIWPHPVIASPHMLTNVAPLMQHPGHPMALVGAVPHSSRNHAWPACTTVALIAGTANGGVTWTPHTASQFVLSGRSCIGRGSL